MADEDHGSFQAPTFEGDNGSRGLWSRTFNALGFLLFVHPQEPLVLNTAMMVNFTLRIGFKCKLSPEFLFSEGGEVVWKHDETP